MNETLRNKLLNLGKKLELSGISRLESSTRAALRAGERRHDHMT